MVGYPTEQKQDVDESIKLAHTFKVNHVAVSMTTPYPGTSLYEKLKSELDFSLFPYKLSYKNEKITQKGIYFQKYFYLRFYFNIKYIKIIQHRMLDLISKELVINIFFFAGYLLKNKSISNRKDYV